MACSRRGGVHVSQTRLGCSGPMAELASWEGIICLDRDPARTAHWAAGQHADKPPEQVIEVSDRLAGLDSALQLVTSELGRINVYYLLPAS